MAFTTLVSTEELAAHLDDPQWLIADCSFALAAPQARQESYQTAHIPGAIYVHLDRDLSGPVIAGQTGRHPLPPPEEAARRFGALGIGPQTQVVAYDDAGGSLAAVRLWWMLRWLGHTAAAVLDGGWQRWLADGRPTGGGWETRPPQRFSANPQPGMSVDAPTVERLRQQPDWRVVDVRAAERYRGEVEPIDPVAGHIPGAVSAPYLVNLGEDGCFRAAEELRQHYQALLGETPAERVAFYCGSGVTSIHSILALEVAGLGQAKLYPGSWSEWIASGERPVARGAG